MVDWLQALQPNVQQHSQSQLMWRAQSNESFTAPSHWYTQYLYLGVNASLCDGGIWGQPKWLFWSPAFWTVNDSSCKSITAMVFFHCSHWSLWCRWTAAEAPAFEDIKLQNSAGEFVALWHVVHCKLWSFRRPHVVFASNLPRSRTVPPMGKFQCGMMSIYTSSPWKCDLME